MAEFIFMGDIKRAGRVVIIANTLEEAIVTAQAGNFDRVYDECRQDFIASFDWNGDDDTIEEVDENRNDITEG